MNRDTNLLDNSITEDGVITGENLFFKQITDQFIDEFLAESRGRKPSAIKASTLLFDQNEKPISKRSSGIQNSRSQVS